MILRMFEYDTQIALMDRAYEDNKLIVNFPNSAVLYLRSKKSTPDVMTVQINLPQDKVAEYEIPILKVRNYGVDEIFEKRLLFLIPFHLFCYAGNLDSINQKEERLVSLLSEYEGIRQRLDRLCEDNKITEFEKQLIIDMTKKVVDNLARNQEPIKEGVKGVMGGKVLEYEAKTILKQGIAQGIEQGIHNLIETLNELGVEQTIIKSKLMEKFHLSEEQALQYLK